MVDSLLAVATSLNHHQKFHEEEMNETRRFYALHLDNHRNFYKEELRKLQEQKIEDRLFYTQQVGAHCMGGGGGGGGFVAFAPAASTEKSQR